VGNWLFKVTVELTLAVSDALPIKSKTAISELGFMVMTCVPSGDPERLNPKIYELLVVPVVIEVGVVLDKVAGPPDIE
tara:strand:+ start:405 stop:638 length:234 start_codon:yes stop_codon:yes gene_type:complete